MTAAHSRPTRIVLANGGLPLGGSTTFLINFAGELIRRGVPVLVTSFERENPMAADFRHHNIPVHLEDQHRHIYEDRLLSTLKVIREFRPTCIVSCLGPTSFEVLRYLPEGIMRLGMVQSDYPEVYSTLSLYAPFLDGAVGVSRSIERNLARLLESRKLETFYLPYGVDIPTVVERPLRPVNEPVRILYLGRLCRLQKRVHLFPRLLHSLIEADIPFTWTIAGDGPERNALERSLRTSAPHQQVRFLGPVSYQSVPTLLTEQDILLLISEAEGLPVSLLEAMARGVVPVISDLPSGVPELVTADTGRLIPVNDINGYTEAIVALHYHRDELQRLASNGAREVHKEFSTGKMTDRWLGVLQRTPSLRHDRQPQRRLAAPLVATHSFLFSPPLRLMRRWLRSARATLAVQQPSNPT